MAPKSSDAPIGAPFTLSVYASGAAPATYQWYRGASGDTSRPVTGEMSAAFTIPTVQESGDYWVRVTNSSGTADSPAASLNAVEVWTDLGPAVVAGTRNFIGSVGSPAGLHVIETVSKKVYLSADGGTTWDGGTLRPLGADPFLFSFLRPVVYSDGSFLTSRDGFASSTNANLAISSDYIN